MPFYHTVEKWKDIFSVLPAPHSAEEAIAQRIIGDMVGYKHNSKYRSDDAKSLANALVAYAQLLQEYGVKA